MKVSNNLNILVVDDDINQVDLLSGYLKKLGYNIIKTNESEKVEQLLKTESVDVVLSDNKMPKVTGPELLLKIKEFNPNIDVVIFTAFGSVDTAVEAMKNGAYDYLTKPINLEMLSIMLKRLSDKRTLISENKLLRNSLREKINYEEIVSVNSKMEELLNQAGRVARSNSTVTVLGESGTGKELMARTIHRLSPRSKENFVAVNCAALNEQLIESELFGHEKGAFTGANGERIGRFEEAHNGTLFLDEIADIPHSVQVKLLRFLQEGELQKVGSNKLIKVDVRLIAATNKNLQEEIRKGNFREDLFYRINVVAFELPPLRERKDDINELLNYYLNHFNKFCGRGIKGYTKEANNLLLKYSYPGNIRELRNIVERAVVLTRSEYITVEDLPLQILNSRSENISGSSLSDKVGRYEEKLIMDAMIKSNWVQTKAADSLGIIESKLRYKLNKYNIKENK